MICATDPWLDNGPVKCASVRVEASGNLGNAEAVLRNLAQPFTRPQTPLQRQALNDAHEAFDRLRAALLSPTTKGTRPTLTTFTLPEIVEPRAGITYPPQTPLKVRVTPPRNIKVQTYLVQFEVLENGSWRTVTNEPVIASELEGPLGYKGWGWHRPGTSPQSIAYAGNWRVRARSTTPDQGEAGAWREFVIGGDAGAQPDKVPKSQVLPGLSRAAGGTGSSTLSAMGSPPNPPNSAVTAKPALKPGQAGAMVMAAPPTAAPLATPATSVAAKKATLDWSRAATPGTASPLPTRIQP